MGNGTNSRNQIGSVSPLRTIIKPLCSQEQGLPSAQEDHWAKFYEKYRREAEEYDRKFRPFRPQASPESTLVLGTVIDLDYNGRFPATRPLPFCSHRIYKSVIMPPDDKVEARFHTVDPDSEVETPLRTLGHGVSFLGLYPDEEVFFKAETGIQDTEELRKHIIEVQEEAYKVSSCCPRTDRTHPLG